MKLPPGPKGRLAEAHAAAQAQGLTGEAEWRYVATYLAIMADRFAAAVSGGYIRAIPPGAEEVELHLDDADPVA